MSRAQISSLDALVDLQNAGGYTLPLEVVSAYERHQQIKNLVPPERSPANSEAAAAVFLATMSKEAAPDLTRVAEDLLQDQQHNRMVDAAGAILAAAREQAADAASSTGADCADLIIKASLRPAFERMLAELATVARDLGQHPPEPAALLTAPAKARTAYSRLAALADQWAALMTARTKANFLGGRTPINDDAGQHAAFRTPQALHPGYVPGGVVRMPRLPMPDDPHRLALWLVGEGAKAEPWMPTVDEQDGAWLHLNGDAEWLRQQNRSTAFHVRAMAGTAHGPSADTRGD